MDRLFAFLIISFAAAAVLTPLFGRLALKRGIIDHPSHRKFHLTTMPLMGGIAIVTVFIVLAPIATGISGLREYWGIIAAALLLAGLGLADDISDISPTMKLAGQAGGTLLMMSSGLMWRATGIQAVDAVLTFAWVIGIINAMNLLDNIDGLSSGTAAIAGIFFALAAIFHGQDRLAYLPIILAGASMGFLLHNFHPATIFLGDAGSMALGTILAGFGMAAPGEGGALNSLAAAVILGLLIFDTGLVSILRLANGRSLSRGGKDHTSHRLCNLGLSIQASVIVLFAVNFFFGCCALIMFELGHPKGMVIPFGLFLTGLMCLYLMKDTYNYRREGA